MNCPLEFVREDGERFVHRCPVCKAEVRSKYCDPALCKVMCGTFVSQRGPGIELFRIFSDLRIKPAVTCGCKAFAAKMNSWGVTGCREHRDEIVEHLKEKAAEFGLSTWATAGWQAVVKGLPWSLAGLVDLAIARAAGTSPAAPCPIPAAADSSPAAPLPPTTGTRPD